MKIMSEKSEYQQVWDKRVQDIEVTISENLMRGVTPEILIATDRTITELCEYLDVIPDWRNTEGRAIAFGDGEVVLRLYRSVDVPYGTLIIR